MNTFTVLEKIEAIAIGGFDGMHIAHQELFKNLGKKGAILVIDNERSTLTPKQCRQVHTHYPIFFYKLSSIKHLDAHEFLNMLLEKFPNLKKIVVGYDFRFGKERAATAHNLQSMFHGQTLIVKEVKFKGISVHSTIIRQLLLEGNVKRANELLGYTYYLGGAVVKGQGLGSQLLYPTINVTINSKTLPQDGVYITLTKLDDEDTLYPSATFLGNRLSTDGNFSIETHILDKKVNVKKKAGVYFLKHLRSNIKFNGLDELKKKIESDITICRQYFDDNSYLLGERIRKELPPCSI